jgi:tRNA U54 and U55 pseudouridine synthase Pus10
MIGEDVDVRMLGEGRPFVIELVDPHRGESTIDDTILEDIKL